MAQDLLEDNELSALSSMYRGNSPFANDPGGYAPFAVQPIKPFRLHAGSDGMGYSNFLGIDLHGAAYHQQEADVVAMEKKFAPAALNTLYPVNQRDCNAVIAVQQSIMGQIEAINQQLVTEKGAFVPRLQAIIKNLVAHRDKIVQANAGMNCPDVETAQTEQQITAALKAAYSVPSNTDKIIMVAIGGVLLLALGAIFVVRKKNGGSEG